jgi:hypothetical protein
MNPVEGRSVVIVAYRPKPGKAADLLQLTREHLTILREEGLATAREAIVCTAQDGTIVEVFEWESGGAAAAHTNERVKVLWARYWDACDIVKLQDLPEATQMFAGFAPLDL